MGNTRAPGTGDDARPLWRAWAAWTAALGSALTALVLLGCGDGEDASQGERNTNPGAGETSDSTTRSVATSRRSRGTC